MECTLSKFVADTKLSHEICLREGKDLFHQEEPDGLEWWAHVNLIQLNKAKCKILCLGLGSPQ